MLRLSPGSNADRFLENAALVDPCIAVASPPAADVRQIMDNTIMPYLPE